MEAAKKCLSRNRLKLCQSVSSKKVKLNWSDWDDRSMTLPQIKPDLSTNVIIDPITNINFYGWNIAISIFAMNICLLLTLEKMQKRPGMAHFKRKCKLGTDNKSIFALSTSLNSTTPLWRKKKVISIRWRQSGFQKGPIPVSF